MSTTNGNTASGHVTQSSPLIGCRMTTLVECWNKLDGNVGELSSWVAAKVMRINWPSFVYNTPTASSLYQKDLLKNLC